MHTRRFLGARTVLAITTAYVGFLLLVQPNWMLGGQMWAEMATNYMPAAASDSISVWLLSPDAGYVPILQRLIAAAFAAVGTTPLSLGYAYTWTAAILSGILAGSFALPIFRPVIHSDFLRIFTALLILLLLSFDTRTFINFSYLAVIPVTAFAALALADRDRDVPRLAWLTPLLVIAKPHVLAALPFVVLAGIYGRSRFRAIAAVSVVLALAQLVGLMLNKSEMAELASNASVWSKLYAAGQYTLTFLGGYLFGPEFADGQISLLSAVLLGLLAWAVMLFLVFQERRRAALILGGLSLIGFSILLNCFALSRDWSPGANIIGSLPIYRHTIVGVIGVVFVLARLLDGMTGRFGVRWLAPIAFAGWAMVTGWVGYGIAAAPEPTSPTLRNSLWRDAAERGVMDSRVGCIPIDPFGWVAPEPCINLDRRFTDGPISYRPVKKGETIEVEAPPDVAAGRLQAIGIVARPGNGYKIGATVSLEDALGHSASWSDSQDAPPAGAALAFGVGIAHQFLGVRSIRITFTEPGSIGMISVDGKQVPAVHWMGIPAE